MLPTILSSSRTIAPSCRCSALKLSCLTLSSEEVAVALEVRTPTLPLFDRTGPLNPNPRRNQNPGRGLSRAPDVYSSGHSPRPIQILGCATQEHAVRWTLVLIRWRLLGPLGARTVTPGQ